MFVCGGRGRARLASSRSQALNGVATAVTSMAAVVMDAVASVSARVAEAAAAASGRNEYAPKGGLLRRLNRARGRAY